MKEERIVLANSVMSGDELSEFLEKMINENIYTNETDIDPDILENLKENLKLIGIDIFRKNYLEDYKKQVIREFTLRLYRKNNEFENLLLRLEEHYEEELEDKLFQDEEDEE
ncbi:hypothetical protein [Lactococcus sp. bn62]|uniref:hypothetical protein n=1 Tax=Lactococcus sp. bn62 TaxID=3037457 RepID=UPI0024C4D35E|nr:hypothetical protein [Lactococcus sp. bn62]WKY24561.1 hypothetical protein P3G65_01760 [Lactococcus sp. bn62]